MNNPQCQECPQRVNREDQLAHELKRHEINASNILSLQEQLAACGIRETLRGKKSELEAALKNAGFEQDILGMRLVNSENLAQKATECEGPFSRSTTEGTGDEYVCGAEPIHSWKATL